MAAVSWRTLVLFFCIQKVSSREAGCIERSLVGKNPLNTSGSSFTASSYLNDLNIQQGKNPDDRYAPSNARLNGNWGWSPRTNKDNSDYLQIDLGAVRVITAVATQGNGGGDGRTLDEWITEYKLRFRRKTNTNWMEYKDTISITKFYKGVIDEHTVVRYNLTTLQTARYIRFIPVKYHEFKTMRVNVYVIEQVAILAATPFTRSIQLSWILSCVKTQQQKTNYMVKVTKKGEFNVGVGRVTSYNITGIQPYTDYEIRVKAVAYELWSKPITIKTSEAVPEMSPLITSSLSNSSSSLVLQWKLVDLQLLHGPLKGYRINYTVQDEAALKSLDVGVVNTWVLTSLEIYTWYTITVSVKNTKYVGPPSTVVKIRTMEDAPSFPLNVQNHLLPSQTFIGPRLQITWDEPLVHNGIIRKYTLIYSYYTTDNKATRRKVEINSSSGRSVILNITMKGMLSFNISATTIKQGPNTPGHVTIPTYPPWAAPTNVSVTPLNTTSIDVSWQAIPDSKRNSNITIYEVNVTLHKTRCNDQVLRNRTNIIQVPGRKTRVEVQGLSLCSVYGIQVRGYTVPGPGPYSDTVSFNKNAGKNTADKGQSTEILSSDFIIGIVVALVLLSIAAALLVVFIIKRRRKRQQQKRESMFALVASNRNPTFVASAENTQSCTRQENADGNGTEFVNNTSPISKMDLTFLTHNGKLNETRFKKEFKSISNAPRKESSIAEKPFNKKKNRYKNIVTYDHSRVVLEDDYDYNDSESDYINASFIHGYDGSPRTYVATQGPISSTAKDFWQMVCQLDCETVVMLTNLVELGKTKCHQYWPERTEKYGDITVTNHQTQVFADYVIRTFLLAKAEKTTRRVRQFHFTAWPDKGVPQHATAILAFRRKVRKETPTNAVPTVIHCSAGVGRTGAYIMIDAMLEKAKHQQSLDIFSYLQTIREDRPLMVQTENQYIFVQMAVYEALACGNTEIEVHKLDAALQNLSVSKNNFAQEFERLRVLTQKTEMAEAEGCAMGNKEENIMKNRYPDIVPVDRKRVILSVTNEDKEDYINASFVDTYRDRNAFIVTQAPLENTVVDFWRMVMDNDIGTIVMLNNLQEGKEVFPRYWPGQETMTCGSITVKANKKESLDNLVVREFQVINSEKKLSVVHLQHLSWRDKNVPSDSQSVLRLINEVEKSQQKVGGNPPILVHCSDGVGRSGTFCVIASTLERVKQEQVLDVFQTVKSVRTNRPGAVQTLNQYKFCYTIIKEYLDSFSDYANFRE